MKRRKKVFMEYTLQEFKERFPKMTETLRRRYNSVIDFDDTEYIVRFDGKNIEIGYREDAEWQIKNPYDRIEKKSQPTGITFGLMDEENDVTLGAINFFATEHTNVCKNCRYFENTHDCFNCNNTKMSENVKESMKEGFVGMTEYEIDRMLNRMNCNFFTPKADKEQE